MVSFNVFGQSSGGRPPMFINDSPQGKAKSAALGFSAGSALSGFGNILGSALNFWGQRKARKSQEKLARQNMSKQEEFAKNSVKWRIQDAKRSGIHPLAAMGASSLNFNPVHRPNQQHEMSKLGQDISRASYSALSPYEKQMRMKSLENAGLKNELLRAELASKKRKLLGQTAPGVPTAPSQDPRLIRRVPQRVTRNYPGRRDIEPSPVNMISYMSDAEGNLTPVPSEDAKRRIEDQILPEMAWAMNAYTRPWLEKDKPPKSMLPPGTNDWKWNGLKWKAVRVKKGRVLSDAEIKAWTKMARTPKKRRGRTFKTRRAYMTGDLTSFPWN